MTYIPNKDFYLSIILGDIPGYSVTHKFGRVTAGGTGDYIWTPATSYTWLSAADTVRVFTHASETEAAKVIIQGLDANFALQEEEITLSAGADVDGTKEFIRLFRAYVSETNGTYHKANSHDIDMTFGTAVSGSPSAAEWLSDGAAQIVADKGQTEMTQYTIPAGKTGLIYSVQITVDGTNTADISLCQYPNADDVSTPFSGAERALMTIEGVSGHAMYSPKTPIMVSEKTDLWWQIDSAAGGRNVSIDYELFLVDN